MPMKNTNATPNEMPATRNLPKASPTEHISDRIIIVCSADGVAKRLSSQFIIWLLFLYSAAKVQNIIHIWRITMQNLWYCGPLWAFMDTPLDDKGKWRCCRAQGYFHV